MKWILYSILVYISFVLQSSYLAFEIFNIKPILIIPLVCFIATIEKNINIYFYIFVFFVGILWDLASYTLFGINSILLLIIVYVCEFLTSGVKRLNFFLIFLICSLTILFYSFLNFMFSYYVFGYENLLFVLLYEIIPIVLYSLILSPISYFLVKFLNNKF